MSRSPHRSASFAPALWRVGVLWISLGGSSFVSPSRTVADDASPVAAEPTSAAAARLEGLGLAERRALAPHLEQGPVGLIEFTTTTELPGVVLAARIDAPASVVRDVLSAPERYPDFMPALTTVDVGSRAAGVVAYQWAWSIGMFRLRGQNVMRVWPSTERLAQVRGHRVTVDAIGGDLGRGRMSFWIYPESASRSLLVFASRLDLRDANYLTRQLSAGGNGVNRSINVALGFAMLLATKARAESGAAASSAPDARRVRSSRRPTASVPVSAPRRGPGVEDDAVIPPLAPVARPVFAAAALTPLLDRGDLVFVKLDGPRLERVALLARMWRGREEVRAILRDPEAFGRYFVPGSRAEVVREEGARKYFEWEIALPLVGSSGTMRLEERPDGVVEVDALEGDLEGGVFRLDTFEVVPGEVGLVAWARFDPADTSWLVRRLVAADPRFGVGLAVASEVMLGRSIRSRVSR